MTYCRHKVTEGYCLDCLRASRDAALARVGVLEAALRRLIESYERHLYRNGLEEPSALDEARAALASPPPHDGEGAP